MSEERPTVVLLHGLARTWLSMAGMRRFVEAQGFETWAQTYPSRSYNLVELADSVTERIRADLGDKPVIGITHSLGGIVARHIGDRLNWQGLVMLAPPNCGSAVARAIHRWPLFKWFYGPAGQEVALGEAWPEPPKPFAVIAGTRGPTLGNLPTMAVSALGLLPNDTPNDGTVLARETQLPGMAAYAEVDVSHTWIMNHPTTRGLVQHFLNERSFPVT